MNIPEPFFSQCKSGPASLFLSDPSVVPHNSHFWFPSKLPPPNSFLKNKMETWTCYKLEHPTFTPLGTWSQNQDAIHGQSRDQSGRSPLWSLAWPLVIRFQDPKDVNRWPVVKTMRSDDVIKWWEAVRFWPSLHPPVAHQRHFFHFIPAPILEFTNIFKVKCSTIRFRLIVSSPV